MEVLMAIGLAIIGLIIVIGIIRVIFNPYTGFLNMLMEMMLIDFLIDGLGVVFSAICDILD